MFQKILYLFSKQRVYDHFTIKLMSNYNLEMIEYARNRDLRSLSKSKEWISKIDFVVENIMKSFSHRHLLIILSVDDFYKKLSDEPAEDIRLNLRLFLKRHYMEVYKMFDMKTYADYQTKDISSIWKIVLIQNGLSLGKRRNVVVILYDDETRICYDIATKKRLVLDELEDSEDTLFITLVDTKYNS